MMKINYDHIPPVKKQEGGRYASKNAFYMREKDEREAEDLYNRYHTDDFFGVSYSVTVSGADKRIVKPLR